MTLNLSRQRRSSRVLTLLTGLSLAVSAGYGFSAMRAAARQVNEAEADLAGCRRMIAEIERMREQPRIASLEVEPPSRIAEQVSAAVDAGGLPPESLIRVEPQAPVRVGRSQYQVRATTVELEDATLEQIVRLAHHLSDAQEGLTVRDLVLSEPRTSDPSQERWRAEVTLTQMIFSPTIQ